MKLIVGLGNPGESYKFTRHNVGFLAVDKICQKNNITLNKEKFNGEFVICDDVIIARPLTYMNNSGDFVYALANFYKIDSSDIIVIYDEKDFKIGQAAIKIGGSSGGHNGIQSIMNHFKTNDFKRLRVGIGTSKTVPLRNYVLSNFTIDEFKIIEPVLELASEAAMSFVFNDINTVMNNFNVNRKK
ncbi:aminoacyl-tRNA hydrolase [Mycoplasmopsis felifaucium]|uniref:aminoacyl-tRNA hydrolase n=1 Tax=Mycoplasmopsis felifaucium TaxID=35768 RepID=UPI000489D3B8|nr:aminoacyl-tRNA hydrolase [Mycoplasmopsis felifaucium]